MEGLFKKARVIIAVNASSLRDANEQPTRQRICRIVLAACLPFATAPAHGQTSPASPAPFVMAAEADPNTLGSKWSVMIYAEAFKRLGIPIEFRTYPLARRAALADEGLIDGEGGRIHGYGAAHPIWFASKSR